MDAKGSYFLYSKDFSDGSFIARWGGPIYAKNSPSLHTIFIKPTFSTINDLSLGLVVRWCLSVKRCCPNSMSQYLNTSKFIIWKRFPVLLLLSDSYIHAPHPKNSLTPKYGFNDTTGTKRISWLWNVSGPMVLHNCRGISISTHPSIYQSGICMVSYMYTVKKEPYTSERSVEMDIPWQLCRTIGPLLLKRFPLASAKGQPMGGFAHVGPLTPFSGQAVPWTNCCISFGGECTWLTA